MTSEQSGTPTSGATPPGLPTGSRGAEPTRSPRIPTDRPALVPFLPLVYVAWSDGVLSTHEMDRVRERLEGAEGLDPEDRRLLSAWLRPEEPPSPSALEALRERLRERAGELPPESRRSLVRMGVEMARRELASGDGPGAEIRDALEAIEDDLGVVGSEAVRSLLGAEAEPREEAAASAFEPEALSRYLDGATRDIRRRVLDVMAEDVFRMPDTLDDETYRARVLDATLRLADEGFGLLPFPERYGGSGDPARAIAVFETLAFGDLSVLVKFGVQFGLFGGSVHQLGTERHHERWLEAIGRLELPGCYAMTERGHGSDVRSLETTATYDPEAGEFVIHTPSESARKDWAGNAALHARMATVFAQLEVGGESHGVHAFLVPLRDENGSVLPGVEIEDCGHKEGLNGVDNGRIAFDEVRIPRENLLNRFADVTPEGAYTSPIPSQGKRFFTMLGTLVAGRISIAAASVSAAKTGLAIAVPYSDRRRQFGPAGDGDVPILDYLAQQRLLLPRLATTYGLHFAIRELVRDFADAEGEELREVEVRAAGLKAEASWHAVETLQACREACGGRGYLAANRFGRLKADVDVFTTFEGANVVLLQLVAKGLLSDFREEMGELRIWDILKYVADRAGTRLTELNPVVTRRTDEEHLLDPEFHRSAFRYREDRLLASVARRLKRLIDEGVDSFEAMNTCQDHLVTLARSHVERVVLDAFRAGVKRAPTPGLSEILDRLAALYAVSRLEAHRGWYLESGYFEAQKSKAVRALVNRLCGEIREQAVFLTDGFGIPPEILDAPAARDETLVSQG